MVYLHGIWYTCSLARSRCVGRASADALGADEVRIQRMGRKLLQRPDGRQAGLLRQVDGLAVAEVDSDVGTPGFRSLVEQQQVQRLGDGDSFCEFSVGPQVAGTE